jgi:hypothetical protein
VKRRLLLAAAALAAAYVAFGATVLASRAERMASAPGAIRGAWHVHTTRSDGLGTLDEVVRAARQAGLQFVVITDHNVLAPEGEEYRDGVLVVHGVELSTRYGHVVALGVGRALSAEERHSDPLGTIAALGGEAILAHPLHPRRPFTGWGAGPWRGFEVVSNDSSWHEIVAARSWGRAVAAAARLPWDRAGAVVALFDDLATERGRFDGELLAARGERAPGDPRPARVLLCSADAHGYPSYAAAFEAFSMHVPVTLSGDAAADARSVAAALLDGSATCVFDGVAPAAGVRFARAGDALELSLEAPHLAPARFTLLRDGAPAGVGAPERGARSTVIRFACAPDGCPAGDYRVEATWNGRPWIFTNPISVD